MRKFSEFGYCCGLAGVAVSPSSNPAAAAAATAIGRRTAPNRRYSRATDPVKKKPRSSSSAFWSPSLSVISEDGVVPHASRGGPPETRRKKISGSGASKSVDIAEESSRSPLNGGNKRKSYSLTSMAMPAFSPTPFVF